MSEPPAGPPPVREKARSRGLIVLVAALVLGFVLAAIELMPAFMRGFKRQTHVLGAEKRVKRLYDAARAYYENGPGAEAKLFPATPAEPTVPSLGVCCENPDGVCPPDPSLWMDPTWRALAFSIDTPHHYSYTYSSSGAGAGAGFTVRAHGDLDCDGVFSTFEMIGSVEANGAMTPGILRKQNEDE